MQSRQVITPSSSGQGSNQLQLVIVKTYLNENGHAVSGKCDRTCSTLIPFLVFLFIVTLITACAQPSAIIVTLRSVRLKGPKTLETSQNIRLKLTGLL